MFHDADGDEVSLAKLKLYKTAYSPLYQRFVGIQKIRLDDRGEPIITARLENEEGYILFRVYELNGFVL